MTTGTVKYVGPDGGWGFISRDDKQPKVFVHISEVRLAGFDEITKGQRWAFTLKTGQHGRVSAIDLEPIP
ncbi:MAG: cold shock domain-containing protein [Parvularcula sp.]|jgi:CspA family cold shock protein|nr:cold shock domain-containing protein [Parvularcula sp.]